MKFNEDQCARCGNLMHYPPCDCRLLYGTAFDPTPYPDCPVCHGHGWAPTCLSEREWCEANPLPGREHTRRHTVEGD